MVWVSMGFGEDVAYCIFPTIDSLNLNQFGGG